MCVSTVLKYQKYEPQRQRWAQGEGGGYPHATTVKMALAPHRKNFQNYPPPSNRTLAPLCNKPEIKSLTC